MKKPSKKWKEFAQIISIIKIKIRREQRNIIEANKKKEELNANIDNSWDKIQVAQEKLKYLKLRKENDPINRFFHRREEIKSYIESLYFDLSILEKDIIELEKKILELEEKKKALEKRQYAMDEVQNHLR